jgi:RNA polymerase sigma factor (sigma-70 family)
LVEDDYRRIRRYDGRSAFSTYLTTVIARLGLDYADHLWGRWRPCSLARRSGAVGVRLDQLIHCDGHTVRDAVELVVRNEAEGRSREELDRLGGQIQRLQRPRWVSLEAARDVASDEEPRFERGAQRAVAVSLWRLLGKLEPTDRELLLQRFVEELPARDVARKLGRSPSEVYRRTAVLLRRLRRELEPMLRLEAGRLSLQERRDRNEIASSRVRLQPTAG